MRETLPVDPAGAGAAPDPDQRPRSGDADRQSRIEELLLSGLDHYFAGKYESAIDIWTRVAFLERGHGRARAYIERARGAQAERQRECEEWLHDGVAAYQAGDVATARTLLTRALEEGGPTDVALAFLQRVNRLESALDAPAVVGSDRRAPASRLPGTQTRWLPTIAVSAAIVAVIVGAALPIASWIAELPMKTPLADAPRPEPLPVVRTSDMLLARARALYAQGKVRETLPLLDRIPRTDPARADADRLLAQVQREVLATVATAARKGTGR
jgi:hypothetical protein